MLFKDGLTVFSTWLSVMFDVGLDVAF